MKENFVIKLNTRENMQVASMESGLYAELEPEDAEIYTKGTFNKAIAYCLEKNENSTLEEEVQLANEIKSMLSENSPEKPLEINVYDENRKMKKKVENPMSSAMSLDDKIESYIDKRKVPNGDIYDYLDMVVYLNSKIGK